MGEHARRRLGAPRKTFTGLPLPGLGSSGRLWLRGSLPDPFTPFETHPSDYSQELEPDVLVHRKAGVPERLPPAVHCGANITPVARVGFLYWVILVLRHAPLPSLLNIITYLLVGAEVLRPASVIMNHLVQAPRFLGTGRCCRIPDHHHVVYG